VNTAPPPTHPAQNSEFLRARCLLAHPPSDLQHNTLTLAPISAPDSASFASRHYPLPRSSSILMSLVFKSLQIPFPATPLFSHPYKTIGRVGPFLSIPCSRVTVHGTSHAFSFVCRLFGAFFALAPFVFNRLQPLFKNHPGGGTSSTISGVALLRSVSFGAPQSRLCDASSRYILGPSLNMRSP
jgi:hypothetical protein